MDNLGVLVVLFFWFNSVSITKQDVYTSGAELHELVKVEKTIVESVDNYLKKDIERLIQLQSFLKDIKDELESSKAKKQTSVDHPINALHVIRRFVTAWQGIFNQVGNFTNYNVMRTILATTSKYLPNNEDFLGAQRSLVRLQHTYHLRTMDMAKGMIMNKPGKPLSEYDCFLLGQRAMESNESPTLAIEWFEEAKRKAHPGYVPIQSQASTALAELYARVQNFHAAVRHAKEAYKYSGNSDTRLRDLVMVYERQREDWLQGYPTAGWEPSGNKPEFWVNYEYLCRISSKKNFKISMDSWKRQCYYQFIRSAYIPHKIEVLHDSPYILLYHDFLSDSEASGLIEFVKPKMQRARVGVTGDNEATEDRIGKIFGIHKHEHDWLRVFDRRIEETFRMSADSPGGEPIQILNYGLGGQYYPHYDYDQDRHKRKYEDGKIPGYEAAGDRIATLLLYLNDATLGGSTVFPEVMVAVPALKNAGVFWYNEVEYGKGDERTLHAGCPVLYGQKWVANKWFREIGHEMHRKCDGLLRNSL